MHVVAKTKGWNKGAADIRSIHKAQGLSDICYNEIINPHGQAEIIHGKMTVGAHIAGFNSISYGHFNGRWRGFSKLA